MIRIEYNNNNNDGRIPYQIIDDGFIGIVTMVDTEGRITREYNMEKYHDIYRQAIPNIQIPMYRIPPTIFK